MHFSVFGLQASDAEFHKLASYLVAAGPGALDGIESLKSISEEAYEDEVYGLLLNSALDGEADKVRPSEKEIGDLLKDHAPSGGGRHYCKVAGCNKHYKNFKSLKYHIRGVHGEGFRCTKCDDVSFRSVQGLRNHIRAVHGEGFRCTKCDHALFRSASGLGDHIKTMHGEGFKCTSCDHAPFISYYRLKKHRKDMHGESKKEDFDLQASDTGFQKPAARLVAAGAGMLSCPYRSCKGKYSCGEKLREHVKERHTRERYKNGSWRCPIEGCNESFDREENLNFHYRAVRHGVLYRCNACDEIFRTTDHYYNHKKIKHEGGFKCCACDEDFKSKSHLCTHIEQKHYDVYFENKKDFFIRCYNEVERLWCCPEECGKKYKAKGMLKLHYMSHHIGDYSKSKKRIEATVSKESGSGKRLRSLDDAETKSSRLAIDTAGEPKKVGSVGAPTGLNIATVSVDLSSRKRPLDEGGKPKRARKGE